MKIVYLLEWDFCQHDGVVKKVLNQVKTWERLGHTVIIFALSNCTDTLKIENVKNYHKTLWNRLYFPKLYADIKVEAPDIIYFRYSAYKPYLNPIFRNYKTVMELNSNVIDERKLQKNNSLKDMFSYYQILFTNRYLESLVAGIVSVTYEIAHSVTNKSEKDIVVIPNSIDLDEFSIKKQSHPERNIPELVFMGTPNQDWHGVDKIIALAKETVGRLNFHVIGIEKPKDIDLVNITFHGYLTKEEYQQIIINSDIGIGTLALHRKNMDEACPLKVREYLAFGLPCIIGYEDTAFIDEDNDFLLKLGNNETNVISKIDKIIEFCFNSKDKVIDEDDINLNIDSNFLEEQRLTFMKKTIYEKI